MKDADALAGRVPTTAGVGMVAAVAVIFLGFAYAAVLGLGLWSARPGQPVGDPWFSMLEILIIALSPAMVALWAAIHLSTPVPVRALSLSGLVFMAMTATVTLSVHFTILTLGRATELSQAPWAAALLSFRWPSLAYALDILAWDLLFPLAMLFTAPVFGGDRQGRAIRLTMIASGVLALGGLAGVVTGDMRLRDIGILGYVGMFLLVVILLFGFFSSTRQGPPPAGRSPAR